MYIVQVHVAQVVAPIQKFLLIALNTDKKKKIYFLIYKEIQKRPDAKAYMTNGLLNIWLNICSVPHLLSPSSYMNLLPIHSEFLIYEDIFFLFYQCTIYRLPGSLLVKLRDIFVQMSTKT
jgi:hypothetical protein